MEAVDGDIVSGAPKRNNSYPIDTGEVIQLRDPPWNRAPWALWLAFGAWLTPFVRDNWAWCPTPVPGASVWRAAINGGGGELQGQQEFSSHQSSADWRTRRV